jgi:hypothetical protein
MSVVLTCEQFRDEYPEFRSKWEDDAKLQPKIDMAHARYSAENAGALYPELVRLRTAKMCWVGPAGAPASKTRNSFETPYDKALEELEACIVHSPIVIGCP